MLTFSSECTASVSSRETRAGSGSLAPGSDTLLGESPALELLEQWLCEVRRARSQCAVDNDAARRSGATGSSIDVYVDGEDCVYIPDSFMTLVDFALMCCVIELVLTITGVESLALKRRIGDKCSRVFYKELVVVDASQVTDGVFAPGEYEYPVSFQIPPHLPSSICMRPTGTKNEDFEAEISYRSTAGLCAKVSLSANSVGAESDLVLCQQLLSPSHQETSLEASATVPVVLVHIFDRESFEMKGVLEKNVYLQREMIRVECVIRDTSTFDIGSVCIALVRYVELCNMLSRCLHSNSNKHSKKAAASSYDSNNRKVSKTIKQTEFPGVPASQDAHTELFLKVETLKKPFFPTVESHFFTISYRVIVECSALGATSFADARLEFLVTIGSKIAPPKVFPASQRDAGSDAAAEYSVSEVEGSKSPALSE